MQKQRSGSFVNAKVSSLVFSVATDSDQGICLLAESLTVSN